MIFVYDTEAKLVAEYSTQVSQNPQVSYLTTDALGSPRIKTDANGQVISRNDYLPFGEELSTLQRTQAIGYKSDSIRRKFTTYKRDEETGLDFAEARYYAPKWGRFTSPDEFTGGPDELFDFEEDAADNPTFYADLTNPQSLNKYLYTYNNPLNLTDPDGHCPKCKPRSPAVIAPLLPIVAALAFILSNPTQLEEKEKPQSTAEAVISTAAVLIPGGKFIPGGKIFGKVLGETAEQGTKQAVKQTVKSTTKQTVKATPSKVQKSVTTKSIGGKFTKKTEVKPSKKSPGQSRAEYVSIKNKDGKTIRTYKDSYDRGNKFQGRKPLRGGPEGRPQDQ